MRYGSRGEGSPSSTEKRIFLLSYALSVGPCPWRGVVVRRFDSSAGWSLIADGNCDDRNSFLSPRLGVRRLGSERV